MAFHEFPFPPGTPLFPRAEVVRVYLASYADHFHLRKHIKFNERVTHLTWDGHTQLWTLGAAGRDWKYDAVVIASGHFHVPRWPDISGINSWRRSSHSMWYREPSPFKGISVVVVGGGPSGIDISTEVSRVARSTIHAFPDAIPNDKVDPDGKLKHRGRVIAVSTVGSSVQFEDGTWERGVDHIIWATGYKFAFPFFSDLKVELPRDSEPVGAPTALPDHLINSTTHVFPLSRHIFPLRDYPSHSLAFIGLPIRLSPFPVWEAQAHAFAAVLVAPARFDAQLEEDAVLRRYAVLAEKCDGSASRIAAAWHRMSEDHPILKGQFEYTQNLLEYGGKTSWDVPNWAPGIYAQKDVLRSEWRALERLGLAEEWVRDVGKGGSDEWVILMNKILDRAPGDQREQSVP